MTIRAFRPVQLVGAPDKVKMKVSQFTPSTQVLSSRELPPAAVPVQFRVGPPGLSVPALGVAERTPVVKSVSTPRATLLTKKSVPRVTRAVMEKEFFFMTVEFD